MHTSEQFESWTLPTSTEIVDKTYTSNTPDSSTDKDEVNRNARGPHYMHTESESVCIQQSTHTVYSGTCLQECLLHHWPTSNTSTL